MKNKMLKLGIIGFGRMGITHYSIINSHPDVEIKGVVDVSSITLKMFKKYTAEVNIYNDYIKLFDCEKLDAVIIATPPNLHYPIAIEAAKNNNHVFIEKPCTIHKVKAQEMSTIFTKKRLVNQVGYVNRYNDIFITVKNIIKNNLIGKIIRFKSEMYSNTITKSGNNWRDSQEKGGGVTFDMAAHAIDLVNYLIGKPDKITGSSLTQIVSKNVEDAINTTLLYKNGISGTINVNWSDESFRKPTNIIEILGTKGKIISNQHMVRIFKKEPSDLYNLRVGWNTIYITDVFKTVPFYVRGNEYTSQLYHFIDCINNQKTTNNCTFKDASHTLQVIETIFEDFKNNGKLN